MKLLRNAAVEIYKNIIPIESVNKVRELFLTSNNTVDFGPNEKSVFTQGFHPQYIRHQPSTLGHFGVSHFSYKELGFVWNNVLASPYNDFTKYKPVYFRVLTYGPTCEIPNHNDGYVGSHTTHSLIIQLSDPNDYTGGQVVVDNKEIVLNQADGVLYDHKKLHAIKMIRSGFRAVLNIRLFEQEWADANYNN